MRKMRFKTFRNVEIRSGPSSGVQFRSSSSRNIAKFFTSLLGRPDGLLLPRAAVQCPRVPDGPAGGVAAPARNRRRTRHLDKEINNA
jgi:hypothetical protein